MSSKLKIVLDSEGVRALLKSPEMRAICQEQASQIAKRAGDGYEVQGREYQKRVGAAVKPVTAKAKKDNNENNTLLKAVRP